jgi:hypothetical protein
MIIGMKFSNNTYCVSTIGRHSFQQVSALTAGPREHLNAALGKLFSEITTQTRIFFSNFCRKVYKVILKVKQIF